jgi:hypothetical protein
VRTGRFQGKALESDSPSNRCESPRPPKQWPGKARPITASDDRARACAQLADRGLDQDGGVATARMVEPPWDSDAWNGPRT